MKSGYIKSGSANIYYELHGESGPVLMLLHGNGESIKYFEPQIEFFKKEYRVLAIDSRGHGESEFGSGELNLGAMAVDVVNVIEGLEFEKVNLLGFSDGANIAMMVAMKNTDLLDKLILVGGNLHPKGMTIGSLAMVLLGYGVYCIANVMDRSNRYQKELFGLMVKEPRLNAEDLSKIRAKTLVMAGSKDMIRTSHTKLIANSIKNSKLEIMNGGDHFISRRFPKEFNNIVKAFLEE